MRRSKVPSFPACGSCTGPDGPDDEIVYSRDEPADQVIMETPTRPQIDLRLTSPAGWGR
ncbi:hypothetical protein ACFOLD_08590 [Kocuria carniphila]|uniref:hypothetical protein n=1 Tax=Kocuria carniphila TaxID=262208 RepID=UPI003613A211